MQFFPAPARHVWQSFLDKLFAQHKPGRRPILRGFLPHLQLLEDRCVPSVFDLIDPKANDSYGAESLTLQELYSAEASGALRVIVSGSFDAANAVGPMPNHLTGPGATVLDAHQRYIAGWKASETAVAAQITPKLESHEKSVGELIAGAAGNALSNPTNRFEIGVAAVCWIVDFGFEGVLTPWCADLTEEAITSILADTAEDFAFAEGHQVIDNLDLSPTTKMWANDILTVTQAGYDLTQFRDALHEDQALMNAPDILARVYHTSHATAGFIGWANGLGDQMKDLFRGTDPATVGIAADTLMTSAAHFQARQIGEAVLDITSQRPLTAAEQNAVRPLFLDQGLSTTFLGFTAQEAQRLFEVVGPLSEFVRIDDGQAVVLGTDVADTIDVYTPDNQPGIIQITVNNGTPVILPRSAIPKGIAVYGRPGGDHISIRSDIASFISGGTGDDVIIGGWGPDVMHGGPGNDQLIGRDGDDLLRGDSGDDELNGGAGNNILNGGLGTNTLIDNHNLIPFQQVVSAQHLAPAPSGSVPILTNVAANPSSVAYGSPVTITAVGADGNGGALLRFEVWEFGRGGRLLGIDETTSDGLAVAVDTSLFSGPGTYKLISHVIGTNGVASNWVARDIVVTAPAARTPTITALNRTPYPAVQQGQTLILDAVVNDPDNTINSMQFIWDRDGSDTLTTGDSILGNGTRSGNTWTYSFNVSEVYPTGVAHFLARARYDNNSQWTDPIARAVEVDPPPNSAPGVTSLTPSNTVLVRSLTLTLTAYVVPGQLPTTEVHFYHDTNGNGVLDPATDQDLGHDSSSSGGWKLSFSTSPFPLGPNTFFARAEDGQAHTDYVIGSTTVTLTNPDSQSPQATLLQPPDVTTTGGISYGFQVRYDDDVAIDAYYFDESLNRDIRVSGPSGNYSVLATFVSVNALGDGTPRIVTYQIVPPGGSWTVNDNGIYRIDLNYQVVADTNGNYVPYGLLGTFTVNIPDDTPPVVSLNSLSMDVTNPTFKTVSTFGVSGSASDPESGVVAGHYHFFLSAFANGVWGEPVDLGPGGPSVTLQSLADGLYAVALQAENGAGFTSSSPSGFFVIDTTAPTVNLSNPANNAFVRQTVALQATAADTNLDHVEFFVDSVDKGAGTLNAGVWSFSFNTTTVTDGSHNWSATAVDAAGNSTATTTRAFTVDNTLPTSNVTPLPVTVNSSRISLSWSGMDGTGSGIVGCNVYVSDNGGAYTLLREDTLETSAFFHGRPGHTYSFYSIATDGVGNVQSTFTPVNTTVGAATPGSKFAFTDDDVDTYTLSLTGPGQMQFLPDDPDLNGKGPIGLVLLQGTDPLKSKLAVMVKKATTGDGRVSIGSIEGTGLKRLTAKASDLVGSGINLSGLLGSLTIRDIRNGADVIALGSPTQKTTIKAHDIGDGTLIAVDSAIASLVAARFGDGAIVAPSMGSLRITGDKRANIPILGDFHADVTLSGMGVLAGKPALKSLKVAGSVLVGSDINVAGLISSISTGGFNGTLLAYSVGSLTVKGDLTASDITITGIGVDSGKPALKSFEVLGAVQGSNISVGGNVNTVSAASFENSTFFVGYTGANDGSGIFNTAATVNTFKVTDTADAFQSSYAIATNFKNVTLKSVKTDNGGTPFGFIANLAVVSLRVVGPPTFTYKPTDGTLKIDGDFEVKIV